MAAESASHRLTRLRVKNFRSIRELDILIGPLTVLVGPNGSGKSNVLDALRFMRDCFTHGLDQAVLDRKGFENIAHWAPDSDKTVVGLGLTYEHSGFGITISYDFLFTANGLSRPHILEETIRAESLENPVFYYRKAGRQSILTVGEQEFTPGPITLVQPGFQLTLPFRLFEEARLSLFKAGAESVLAALPAWHIDVIFARLEQVMTGALFYAVVPFELRSPQRIANTTRLEERGENLGGILRKALQDPYTADVIRLTLSRLTAGVTGVSVQEAGSYLITYLHYHTSKGARKADLEQESDGTLRALAIVAALYQPVPEEDLYDGAFEQRALLAFEEPELYVHPGMLAVLAELFAAKSAEKQILLTTHSPELLDYLPPESFLVVEKTDGETVVGPLADYQIETVRQKLFTPGELLRMQGLHRQDDTLTPATPDAV